MTAGAAAAGDVVDDDELVVLVPLAVLVVAEASQLAVTDVELELEPEVELEVEMLLEEMLCEVDELVPSPLVLVCEHEQLTVPVPETVCEHGLSDEGELEDGPAAAIPPRPSAAKTRSTRTPTALNDLATFGSRPLANIVAPSPPERLLC